MRSPAHVVVVAVALVGLMGPRAAAADTVTSTVTATAQLSSRTSLTVSSRILRFQVTSPDRPATAEVDFVAAARTHADGQVILTVEPVRAVHGPGGAADVETVVMFAGDSQGTLAGRVSASSSSVAGVWTGSGRRSGRLVFSLQSAAPGAYTLPVRFVLSAP